MTTVQRIIPDAMRPIEKVVADASASTETLTPQKTTARVENIKEGLCPICHTTMARSSANGHEVLFCPEHSLVMPIRDVEPTSPLGLPVSLSDLPIDSIN